MLHPVMRLCDEIVAAHLRYQKQQTSFMVLFFDTDCYKEIQSQNLAIKKALTQNETVVLKN